MLIIRTTIDMIVQIVIVIIIIIMIRREIITKVIIFIIINNKPNDNNDSNNDNIDYNKNNNRWLYDNDVDNQYCHSNLRKIKQNVVTSISLKKIVIAKHYWIVGHDHFNDLKLFIASFVPSHRIQLMVTEKEKLNKK